jgi:hypothetical protein
LLEVLTIAEDIGSKLAEQSAMDACAGLAAMKEDWGRTAQFYGMAEALTTQTGLTRDPSDATFLAPFIAQAKQALGSEAFAASESAGRRLSSDRALAQARAWLVGLR